MEQIKDQLFELVVVRCLLFPLLRVLRTFVQKCTLRISKLYQIPVENIFPITDDKMKELYLIAVEAKSNGQDGVDSVKDVLCC